MQAVKALYEYMKCRAAFERVEWKLSVAYLQEGFDTGCRTFFGVELAENGTLLADNEQPKFFREYRKKLGN